MARILVFLPTYNEAENIERMVGLVLSKNQDIDVLVLDDESPDGTGVIADRLSGENNRVKVIHGARKRGRGLAGRDGYIFGLKEGYDIVLEMDADGSHDPEYIPSLLSALSDADMVLGSRRIEGGGEEGRSGPRVILTYLANLYIRILLGVRVKDCNSGFRCFKREVLTAIDVEKIFSTGPGIVQEVLYKVHLKGFRIKEVPIMFKERQAGISKLGLKAIIVGLFLILKLKLKRLSGGIN